MKVNRKFIDRRRFLKNASTATLGMAGIFFMSRVMARPNTGIEDSLAEIVITLLVMAKFLNKPESEQQRILAILKKWANTPERKKYLQDMWIERKDQLEKISANPVSAGYKDINDMKIKTNNLYNKEAGRIKELEDYTMFN